VRLALALLLFAAPAWAGEPNVYEGKVLAPGESSLRASSRDRLTRGERMCRQIARAIAAGYIGYQDCDPATEEQRVADRHAEMERELCGDHPCLMDENAGEEPRVQ